MTRDLPALHRIKQSPGLVRTEVHEAPWAEATLNQVKVPGPRAIFCSPSVEMPARQAEPPVDYRRTVSN